MLREPANGPDTKARKTKDSKKPGDFECGESNPKAQPRYSRSWKPTASCCAPRTMPDVSDSSRVLRNKQISCGLQRSFKVERTGKAYGNICCLERDERESARAKRESANVVETGRPRQKELKKLKGISGAGSRTPGVQPWYSGCVEAY